MKIRYLMMVGVVMVSTFNGASLALSRTKKMTPVVTPDLVQPQAEKRTDTRTAIALTDWIHLSSKYYHLRRNLR